MPKVLFVSDIHLRSDDDAMALAFQHWLLAEVTAAHAIYLLGDIFDAWLGDDLHHTFPNTTQALIQASTQTNIYFLAGNHDFLIGQDYLKRTHMHRLSDPTVIDVFGENVLVTHGDLLCSDDIGYQRFRQVIQHTITKRCFLKLPLAWRKRVAKQLQRNSRSQTAKKSSAQMDVCEATLEKWAQTHQVKTVVHGHTHKPGKHLHKGIQRYVLGAWHDAPNALSINADHQVTEVSL